MQIKEHHLPPGHLLQNGSYRIVKALGQGGFGITYEAENVGSKLVPKVAIKEFFMKGCVRGEGYSVASHSVAEGEFHRFRESFLKEAQMLKQFRHQGIVEVRDLFEENNTAYMVMNFVEGKTLKQIVDTEGAIPKEKAIDYLQQLCEALAAVHAQNAVHRDISPDNVILTPQGRTVLIDFGAAKQYLAKHTQSSVGLVKDGFSPLEQYSLSSKKGPWSDVYALGALAYFLLTAERPMPAIDRYDDHDWQPMTGHAEVDEVLAKAMGMQPGKRYPNAGALRAALSGEVPPLPPEESGQTYKHPRKPPSDPPVKPKPNEATPKQERLQPSPSFNLGWIVGSVVVLVLVAWGVGLFQGQHPGVKQAASGTESQTGEPDSTSIESADTLANPALAQGQSPDLGAETAENDSRQEANETVTPAQQDNASGAALSEEQDSGTKQAPNDSRQQTNETVTPAQQDEASGAALSQEQDSGTEQAPTDSRQQTFPPASRNRQNGDILKDVLWLEMVYVEGGSFEMGSNDGNSDEKPVHSIELSSFYMGKTEVTQAQWRRVMGSYPPELQFKGCDQCPVENVSWNDIQEFLQKLNRMTGQSYRLPTEAEWEYAARGGNQSRGYTYAGSNTEDEVAWYGSNSGSKTHPVAGKKPNELGLYDMTGNVWEWCADWYGKDYYAKSPRKDPQGPSSGIGRVVRGSSWDSYGLSSGVALRFRFGLQNRLYYLGFRLCRDL